MTFRALLVLGLSAAVAACGSPDSSAPSKPQPADALATLDEQQSSGPYRRGLRKLKANCRATSQRAIADYAVRARELLAADGQHVDLVTILESVGEMTAEGEPGTTRCVSVFAAYLGRVKSGAMEP